MIIPPRDEARIAANRAKKQLLINLEEKFLSFSSDGRKLFVTALIAVRALVERNLKQDALEIVQSIDLTPYISAYPEWPQIKADIESLFT